jgi:hypothetical protein
MPAPFQALLDHLGQEWSMISSDPIAFVTCVLIVCAGMFAVMRLYFAHEISSRDAMIRVHEERHKLKDERLQKFLADTEHAGPEKLIQEIQLLKQQVSSRWQSLSDQERTDFVATLRELKIEKLGGGPSVMIFPDFTHHDAVELSHTLSALCHDADWYGMTYQNPLRKGAHSPPGFVVSANKELPAVQTFMKALDQVHIQYQLAGESHLGTIEIKIGRRIV